MKIQASSWHRIKNCPGSLFLEETLPEGERYNPFGTQAGFGSLLHEAGEKTLLSGEMTKARCQKELKALGVGRGHTDFDRAIHTVWFYVSEVKNRAKGARLRIEEKNRTEIHGFDCVAKADAVIEYPGGHTEIIDLKTGNFDYSDSAASQIEFTTLLFPGKTFSGTIIQPWYWEEAYRVVSGIDVTPEDHDRVYDTIKTLEARRDDYAPGSWCSFCPALRICPSARLDVAVVEKTMDITNGELSRLSSDDLGRLWAGKKRVQALLDSLDDVIMSRLQAGELVPGVQIEQYNGRRAWISPEEAEKALEYLGEDRYDKKLKSPAQMEKLAGKANIIGLTEAPRLSKLAARKVIEWGTE